nr:hypothetical protein [Abalone asfa-like virus]
MLIEVCESRSNTDKIAIKDNIGPITFECVLPEGNPHDLQEIWVYQTNIRNSNPQEKIYKEFLKFPDNTLTIFLLKAEIEQNSTTSFIFNVDWNCRYLWAKSRFGRPSSFKGCSYKIYKN